MVRRSQILLGLLGIIIIVLLVMMTPLVQTARSAAWSSLIRILASLAKIGPLQIENDVASQMQNLLTENIRLRAEVSDYADLRQQLGSTSFEQLRSIPALIIARPTDTFRTELVLNKGIQNGVTLDSPVVTGGSILIGHITKVFEQSSVLQLLLNPTSNITAEVLEQDNTQGLLRGRAYTSVFLTTIPRDALLLPNMAVVTRASEKIPAGLQIGTIQSVRHEQNEAYQEALVALPYDPDDLKAAVILVKP